MHRFFVEKENIEKDLVVLHGQDVSHIRTVLRLTRGDKIEVLDGEGRLYLVSLVDLKGKSVKGEILSSQKIDTESPLKIHLGQSLIKGNGFDVVIRKAVELGVAYVSPLITDRTVAKSDNLKKLVRWKKIAEESSKQCGRSTLPVISEEFSNLEKFCQQTNNSDLKLIFWEEEKGTGLSDIKPEKTPGSASVLIGPEGGFTREEVETARDFGFQSIGLGPRILRAETAPLVVLSLLQAAWGDLN
ncbi:MAG: 16S rRNA (uracil(1498)-N(3))-methyltransferase [Nitrospinota bacterium]